MNTATRTLSELKGITLASLNIRSLYRSLDVISTLLNKTKVDYFLIQETFLNNSIDKNPISIYGYNTVRSDRNMGSGKSSGGGILTYVRDKITYEELTDLTLCTPHLEIHWVKMILKDTRDTFVANAYLPPDG